MFLESWPYVTYCLKQEPRLNGSTSRSSWGVGLRCTNAASVTIAAKGTLRGHNMMTQKDETTNNIIMSNDKNRWSNEQMIKHKKNKASNMLRGWCSSTDCQGHWLYSWLRGWAALGCDGPQVAAGEKSSPYGMGPQVAAGDSSRHPCCASECVSQKKIKHSSFVHAHAICMTHTGFTYLLHTGGNTW